MPPSNEEVGLCEENERQREKERERVCVCVFLPKKQYENGPR